MPRVVAAGLYDEIEKPVVRPVHLFTGYFPSGTVYLTDAAVDLTWSGVTYNASGFLGFSEAEETAELTVSRVTVSLSNVDLAVASVLLNETYFNRRATVSIAFLNDSLAIIAAPQIIVDGRMDRPVLTTDPDSQTCSGAVDVVSWMEPLQSARGRHTSTEDQQRIFPGDLGFSNIPNIPEQIVWSDHVFGSLPSAPTSGNKRIHL